jgi:cell wall assembly regulator SMI1
MHIRYDNSHTLLYNVDIWEKNIHISNHANVKYQITSKDIKVNNEDNYIELPINLKNSNHKCNNGRIGNSI